jgi:uncharacterized membrane protein YGL010W
MLCPPLKRPRLVEDWLARHQNPINLILHVAGIPPTLAGFALLPVSLILGSLPLFAFALVVFILGYALQFVGHMVDGSMPGELTALHRWWIRRRAVAAPALVARSEEHSLGTP